MGADGIGLELALGDAGGAAVAVEPEVHAPGLMGAVGPADRLKQHRPQRSAPRGLRRRPRGARDVRVVVEPVPGCRADMRGLPCWHEDRDAAARCAS